VLLYHKYDSPLDQFVKRWPSLIIPVLLSLCERTVLLGLTLAADTLLWAYPRPLTRLLDRFQATT
jgi:hypothetical protein